MLVAVAVATPFLLHTIPTLGFALQRGFALVCHQQAGRSFFLLGGSVAVCARCLGIYVGAAVGLLIRISRRLAWRLFVAAGAVSLVDWLAEAAGLHGNWVLVRFVLGCALGVAAAMQVASAAGRTSGAIQPANHGHA